MRPQLAILFLTALLPFLCVHASQVAQVENRLEVHFDYAACDDLWTEIVSYLNPANIAEKVQKALFVSNLLGMPSMANADSIQVSLDLAPEFLQRGLENIFSEETGTLSRFFETVINGTVALRVALHDLLELASADSVLSSDAPLAPVLDTVATFVAIVRDDFRARFPLPAMAPGHAKREKHVSDALEYLQQFAIRPTKNHGIEQEVIERHLAGAKPLLHNVGVLIGDVAELYPEAIEALLSVGAVLWPEAVLVRSLVILYCFGPYVLGKDVIGGWLFKQVSETSRIWQMQVVLRS